MSGLYENLRDIEVASSEDHHVAAGIPLYERTFDYVLKFHPPGVAPVKDSTGAFHINTKGEDLYSHRFKRTFGFYDKIAAVQLEKGWSHITVTGEPLYEERYRWCGNFQEGLCSVQDETGHYFHINSLGQRVYRESYTYVGDYKDGVAVVHASNGATHIDRCGALLHGRWFADLDVFHKGFARARDDSGWCHITKEGRPLYEGRFLTVEPFYNGIARVINFDEDPLLIDEQGRVVHSLCGPDKTQASRDRFCHQGLSEKALKKKAFQELSGDFVGFWSLEIIKQAINLSIFDFLPASSSGLSKRLNIPEETLQRLLRALEEIKIVRKEAVGKQPDLYELTVKGSLLYPTYEAPMAAAALMWGHSQQEWQKRDFLRSPIGHSPTFKERCLKKEKVALYQRALEGYAQIDFCEIDRLIDWSLHEHVLGVGYVAFFCLQTILKKHPHLSAAYYYNDVLMNRVDIPALLENRLSKVGLDCLDGSWPGSSFDAILFPRFLHYFPDSEVRVLLSKAKEKLGNKGKLYIFEMLLSEEEPSGGLLDINMLVESGGKLRTSAQLRALLANVNLKMTSLKMVHPHLHLVTGEARD